MMNVLSRVGLIITCLVTPSLFAEPVVWAQGRRRGDAIGDSRFHQMVRYDMHYGMYYPEIHPLEAPKLVTRTGAWTGDRIAREVIARGFYSVGANPSPNLAICITNFAMRGLPQDQNFSYAESESEYPSLYMTTSDTVPNAGYVSETEISYNQVGHGPWMRSGITAAQSWTADFVAAYDAVVDAGHHAARPCRIIFDQEIATDLQNLHDGRQGGAENNWPYVWAFWQGIKADPRYSTELVPGGTQTLSQLWAASGLNEPHSDVPTGAPGDPYSWDHIGGHVDNHNWVKWWSALEVRALGGAIREGVIQQIATAWPGVKGCDYDSTIKTNGLVCKSFPGTYPDGFLLAVDQDLANALNNLHMYSDGSADLWAWYRIRTPRTLPTGYTYDGRWRNTADQGTPINPTIANGLHSPRITSGDAVALPGDEFWEESSLRLNRYNLDLCLQKNLPASVGAPTTPLTAWITLPTQPMAVANSNGLNYDGLSYGINTFMGRTSTRAVYRTLAAARTHGVNEFMVWNDTGTDADGTLPNYGEGIYNVGVHPDYAANWNTLCLAVKQVYDYNVASVAASMGTLTLPTGATGPACLTWSDEGVPGEALGSRSARVTSAVGSNAIATITFQRTRVSDAAPTYLNFEIDVIPELVTSSGASFTPTFNISFYNYSTSAFQSVNLNSTVQDLDYHNWPGLGANLNKARLRVRIPYNAVRLNASNQCKINLSLVGVSGYAVRMHIDSAICYGSNEQRRKRGDLNGDGVADGLDVAMFQRLWANPDSYDPDRLGYRKLVDFNHDNAFTPADSTMWDDIWAHKDDFVDDYRQAGNDPRQSPF